MEQSIDINDNNNNNNDCTVREQDRFMPIANVIRIMRKILPPHAKISDNAKETIQECVSEYISFITSEANDRCQREQRKTITAEDVLWAMRKLGFDDYIEPLTFYINRYRDLEGGDRGSIRAKPLMNRAPMDPDPNGLFNGPMGGFQYHPHQHPSVDADASIGNGFQYYPQHQHQHLGGAGAGTSTANGFYPHMVGYVKKATSSQAMGGIEHHGQYGQGRNN